MHQETTEDCHPLNCQDLSRADRVAICRRQDDDRCLSLNPDIVDRIEYFAKLVLWDEHAFERSESVKFELLFLSKNCLSL